MPYADKDRQREYQRQRIAAIRTEWITLNGPCVDCGSNSNLEVDHADPSKKKYQPATLWSMSKTNPVRIDELAKCVVRCSKCHKAKTKNDRVVKHGIHRYNAYGCRCNICYIAKKEYNAKRRYDSVKKRMVWT